MSYKLGIYVISIRLIDYFVPIINKRIGLLMYRTTQACFTFVYVGLVADENGIVLSVVHVYMFVLVHGSVPVLFFFFACSVNPVFVLLLTHSHTSHSEAS